MPRRVCPRHPDRQSCTCAMGNLYRFVEPVLLLLLNLHGRSHGYELSGKLAEYALTDAEIEAAALYKTLRQLEGTGCVTSEWDLAGPGPARRVYALTPRGREHLDEWIAVIDHMSRSMSRFVRAARAQPKPAPSARARRRPPGDFGAPRKPAPPIR